MDDFSKEQIRSLALFVGGELRNHFGPNVELGNIENRVENLVTQFFNENDLMIDDFDEEYLAMLKREGDW